MKEILRNRDPLKMKNQMRLQAMICLECIWKQIVQFMKQSYITTFLFLVSSFSYPYENSPLFSD